MGLIDPLILTGLMFGLMMFMMITGMPLTFALGVSSLAIVIQLWGTGGIEMIYYSCLSISYSYSLTAIPPFIFLGVILEKSGVGKDFFDMVYRLMGGVAGGLLIGTIGVCAVIAAIVGQTGPATVMMGLIALPVMLKRGYNKRMVTGAIQAGGALGILIPPSVTMIVYGFLAQESVGRLFAAGILPGILLTILFMLYVYLRCKFSPHLGPPISLEERVNWYGKLKSMKGLFLPGLLIFLVLGLVILGVTSTTEAAGIGALGGIICAALQRNLTWKVLKESVYTTGRIMGMIMWIMIPAVAFSKIYHGLGAQALLENLINSFGLGKYSVLTFILISYYILGCFLETAAISFLTIPLYVPIIVRLGFDPIWFGIIYILSMESAYLTPPYGFNLFYMKAIAPPEITIQDIYISVVPYVGLQVLATIICIIFPEIILWLPNLLFSR